MSQPKFERHEFWRHKNAVDVFFKIRTVIGDSGKGAIIYGDWCTQGVHGWWFTYDARLCVTPKQYTNWEPYKPRGQIRL